MISRLRNWWGTLPASSERAPKTSPSASAPLGTAPSVLATPKDEQPNKATVHDGRELFLAASSAEEREQVLKNHPFWQTKDVELQLGVAEVAAVIEHVSELYAKYHFRLSHPLAYSLYVHKHAPIYLEEARPLPDAWSMALSLSTTGLEFKEILLNAAHLKMNPEQKPETITLPALEV